MASGDLTLELGRRLPAPPPSVWNAFTEPDRLAQWWGPQGFSIPSLRFEPRVGEGYRIEMQPPEGEAFYLAGEFRAVEPPRRLTFTCFVIAGFETPKPAVASPTVAGPSASRSTMPRRIGCEMALNGSLTIWLTVPDVGSTRAVR